MERKYSKMEPPQGGADMEVKRWLLTDRHLQDLNPLIAGDQACPPGHCFGPNVRNYTLLHYVYSGKGTFYARGQVFPVGPGQAFLILPGEVTTYQADDNNPWHYRWIGFNGSLSQRFSTLPPVFALPEELFSGIFPEAERNAEYLLAAGLLQLYARLFPEDPGANTHVTKVQDLIRAAYMQPLRVETIAKEMNLDRRYLTRLFKSQTGRSIQEYLIDVRLDEADRCLECGCSVQETAQLCGYEDASNFSRLYKKHRGYSPRNRS